MKPRGALVDLFWNAVGQPSRPLSALREATKWVGNWRGWEMGSEAVASLALCLLSKLYTSYHRNKPRPAFLYKYLNSPHKVAK